MITVHVFDTIDDLARGAAEAVIDAALAAVHDHGSFLWCVAGGETPRPAYEKLARALTSRMPWFDTQIFFGDERCVPPSDDRSNFRMVQQSLLAHVPIAPAAIHRIEGEFEPERAAANYEARLRTLLGTGPSGALSGRFDVTWLGMGADGHTASLFPHSVDAPDRLVEARQGPDASVWRITLLPSVLTASRAIQVLVAGSGKADRVAEVLTGPARPDALPIQRVMRADADSEISWLIDRAAAEVLLQGTRRAPLPHLRLQLHS